MRSDRGTCEKGSSLKSDNGQGSGEYREQAQELKRSVEVFINKTMSERSPGILMWTPKDVSISDETLVSIMVNKVDLKGYVVREVHL